MTEYVITELEYQRQYSWEPVCHPGMDDCIDTWVSHVYCTSPVIITGVVSFDEEVDGKIDFKSAIKNEFKLQKAKR